MTDNTAPSRRLTVEGAYNVRDLGGYSTADGQRTRWGMILRSDSLHRLPTSARASLIEFGLRTVIDLRRTQELENSPNVFADANDVDYRHYNMVGDEPLTQAGDSLSTTGESSDRILSSYRLVLDLRQFQVRQVLATLASPGALPALYHCAGGKDRTGIISALVLGIAGVPGETIAEDYALTARYLVDRYVQEQAAAGVTSEDYTWEDYQAEYCPPEAMLKVLGHLEERYGGIDAYVRATGLSGDQINSIRNAMVE